MYILRHFNYNNYRKHLYENNNYGHFSNITANNIFLYPKYLLAKKYKYNLKVGDCLFIPKKWWHWVISETNTLAINYWVNDNIVNKKKPFHEKNYIQKLNIKDFYDKLNNTKINYYNSDIDIGYENINFNKINKNLPKGGILTLKTYINNPEFKSILKNYIKHPDIIVNNSLEDNFNLWYNVTKMDTGLHYDDMDGLLCVLEGEKTVYLYPPSESKYLYPHDLQPKWIKHNFEDIEFNIYLSNNIINKKLPSSKILFQSFTNTRNENCKIVDFLYKKYGMNKIIYGIKCDKNNGKIWWEYYFYNIDKYRKTNKVPTNKYKLNNKLIKDLVILNILDSLSIKDIPKNIINNSLIISFEVHEDKKVNDIDLTIPVEKKLTQPFHAQTYSVKLKDFKNTFIFDKMTNFIANIDEHLTYIKLNEYKEQILNELNKYKYVYYMAIYKKGNMITLLYYGLNMNDFLDFLKENNWPEHFTKWYENNKDDLKHIKREIAVNYKIIDNNLIIERTSLYGII